MSTFDDEDDSFLNEIELDEVPDELLLSSIPKYEDEYEKLELNIKTKSGGDGCKHQGDPAISKVLSSGRFLSAEKCASVTEGYEGVAVTVSSVPPNAKSDADMSLSDDELLAEACLSNINTNPMTTQFSEDASATPSRARENPSEEKALPAAVKANKTSPPSASTKLEAPANFEFTFEPYDIQVKFMQNLFRTIESGGIGIFESPTGTGKSLSLICGALTWLRLHEQQKKEELDRLLACSSPFEQEDAPSSTAADWISEQTKRMERKEAVLKLQEEVERPHEKRLLAAKIKSAAALKRKAERLDGELAVLKRAASFELLGLQEQQAGTADDQVGPEELLLDEYFSGDDDGPEGDEREEFEQDSGVTKIFYCSRTHSQLSQFVSELQRSPFGDSTRCVSLGSRQNMCINENVSRLKNLQLINDACLQMQKSSESRKKSATSEVPKRRCKAKKAGSCSFFKQGAMASLRDDILTAVGDIEQTNEKGRKLKACPYYSSRHAVPAAQLVALPYNLLLHRSTREACGIQLKGNVVIIDEAHNLVETISNIYSVQVTGAQLNCAFSQLSQYTERYRSRLKAKNIMYVKQLLFILKKLIDFLEGKALAKREKNALCEEKSKGKPSSVNSTYLCSINDFLFDARLDNLNFFKLIRYCRRSRIAQKLHGFSELMEAKCASVVPQACPGTGLASLLSNVCGAEKRKDAVEALAVSEVDDDGKTVTKSPLMIIESFLAALTNVNKDGRIVINRASCAPTQNCLKFLLLNPAVHFAEILSEARSIIVAGGTMQPVEEFSQQLFLSAGAQPARIHHFSCGHVVPSCQLLPIALAQGSSGLQLDFTYQSRDSPQMVDQLGRVLCNVTGVVPAGLIVFFPSYEVERRIHARWELTGMLEKIGRQKKIFREPRRAALVDVVLDEFAETIKNRGKSMTGAILFCVVGGKMSEGINFSDNMGRCVVMVGMPYPNSNSPELKEKMSYLNESMVASSGKQPGQVHYENLCMKAVNQSIGRVIRHRDDYGCILLLDRRYLRPSVASRLPHWIGRHLVTLENFGPAISAIKRFFTTMEHKFRASNGES